MAKNKQTGEHPSPDPADNPKPPVDPTNAELERRIGALEKSVTDLNTRIFDSHKWFVTIMFSAVAALLTVYGVLSRIEVREATRDMQARVDKATDEMKKDFKELAGDALKKPSLTVSTTNGPLEGKEFEIAIGMTQQLPFEPLFIKNDGDRRTDTLSVKLFCSDDLYYLGNDWSRVPSDEKGYPYSYFAYLRGVNAVTIAPKETWTLATEVVGPLSPANTNVVACKLTIFYGADKPFEAKFVMKFKR